MGVADLIQQAKLKGLTDVPKGAVVDLKKLLAHNDTAPRNRRVSAEQAMKLLADEHGLQMARSKFDRIVKQYLGRGWGC